MAEKDHSHHHHPHEHHGGHDHAHGHSHEPAVHAQRRHAPSRFRSLIALSGMQRLLLVLPVIVVLWILAFWAMGWLG